MNESQHKAILTSDNALIIAGPGSGKTFTIINKVNYLISNNLYKEKEILLISFTNESVNDLKNKIKYNVDIKTFHKLGLDILKNPNIKICPSNYLSYIIDEYFNYAFNNKKVKKVLKRLLINTSINNLKELIITFINLYKSNYSNINYLLKLYKKSILINKDYLKIIVDIYYLYDTELKSQGMLDFNDMIIESTNQIKENIKKTNYKYIIIDEFQDTSLIRFNLIKEILNQNNGTLFAVGDDFQSIYRFSGCDLNLFLNLNKYIQNLKIITLDNNYRNSQKLINISNKFIMKNKYQIKKNSICQKDLNKPIKIYFYKTKETAIKNLLKLISGNILILGRNNKDKEFFKVPDNIPYLTIHKSKGLEEDNIIIINFEKGNNGFPNNIKNNNLINKIIPISKYPYEEERRLFYVALTRSKNYVYLLVPKNNYSIFIKELINDYKKDIDINYID